MRTIKCPKCDNGTLELLRPAETLKLFVYNLGDIIPEKIYGCDECKYWIDAEDIDLL